MLRTIRLATILTVSSLAMLGAPLVLGGAGGLELPGYVAHAKKGGSAGGDNGGGNQGNGGESHGNSGESHGKSGGGDAAGGNGSSKKSDGGKSSVSAAAAVAKGAFKGPSEQNFHAQLAGLNSLKRNVNGLMNSSDPRMEGIRAFVIAGAELESALSALDAANLAQQQAGDAYQQLLAALELTPYDGAENPYGDFSAAALHLRLSELQGRALVPGDEGYDAWLAEIAGLDAAIPLLQQAELVVAEANRAVANATEAVAVLEAATDDESLTDALVLAANDNRVARYGDEYVTDELLAWAKSVLGVGDASGAIDKYIAQQ